MIDAHNTIHQGTSLVRILVLFLFAGVIVFASSIGTYYYLSNQMQMKENEVVIPPRPIATTQQTPKQVDISLWTTYRNETYAFEFKHPDSWSVYPDEARYPESNESYPRFTVTQISRIKDLKCYVTFIFKNKKAPEKNTYSLYSETYKKQNCQIILDRILSTFKLL